MAYEYQPWPCWCTGPDGERRVFDCLEDVPAGWAHHEDAKLPQLDHDGNGVPGGSVAPVGDMKALRTEYQAKTGKRAFPGWDEVEIRKRMA